MHQAHICFYDANKTFCTVTRAPWRSLRCVAQSKHPKKYRMYNKERVACKHTRMACAFASYEAIYFYI